MTAELIEVDCNNFIIQENDEVEFIQDVTPGEPIVEEVELVQVIEIEGETIIETEEVVEIIEECKQGLPGAPGTGLIQTDTGPVLNGATVTADQVSIVQYRSVKWLVTIRDDNAGEFRSFEVMAVHNGATPFHSVYSKIGNSISVITDVIIDSGFLRLRITNQHGSDININAVRIPTTN